MCVSVGVCFGEGVYAQVFVCCLREKVGVCSLVNVSTCTCEHVCYIIECVNAAGVGGGGCSHILVCERQSSDLFGITERF